MFSYTLHGTHYPFERVVCTGLKTRLGIGNQE